MILPIMMITVNYSFPLPESLQNALAILFKDFFKSAPSNILFYRLILWDLARYSFPRHHPSDLIRAKINNQIYNPCWLYSFGLLNTTELDSTSPCLSGDRINRAVFYMEYPVVMPSDCINIAKSDESFEASLKCTDLESFNLFEAIIEEAEGYAFNKDYRSYNVSDRKGTLHYSFIA